MDILVVRDVMTGASIHVDRQAPMVDIARLMREHGIDDVLVTDEDKLLGVVNARDLVLALADDLDPHNTIAEDLVKQDVVAVHADDGVSEAMRLMRSHALHRLPVLEAERVVGVVTWIDVDQPGGGAPRGVG
ncbi:CBS domain-containing protein [Catellatospora tritici]|uniref:CBS domain-containing protein n=1 Tax=Catellatospora tritici TaxID=2851566 RepID=UPI001C2CEF90|nr:CBS domain-containing protein [Catellatospora tritici]MBV1853157.1 CBS domain-containing protein [Catellatospora tritici]